MWKPGKESRVGRAIVTTCKSGIISIIHDVVKISLTPRHSWSITEMNAQTGCSVSNELSGWCSMKLQAMINGTFDVA